MAKQPDTDSAADRTQFGRQLADKLARKLDAQRRPTPIVWSGLGMMGLIGWSVTVPTLLGAALGAWMDRHYPQGHSWTLALLAGGLALGCWNAWHWVARENREMHRTGGGRDE